MSTDQPDAKKTLEGHIGLKKTIATVNDKPLTETNVAATAAERWQAELAKVQLPTNVKMTMAHPGVNHDLPMMLASASVQTGLPGAELHRAGKPAGQPSETKVPGTKPLEVKAAPAAPPAAAPVEAKANQGKPPETKQAAPEGGFMSSVHWLENKAGSAAEAVKNFDYKGTLQSAAANPGSLTNIGMVSSVVDEVRSVGVKKIYDNLRHADAKTVATDVVIAGGALVALHYGGAAVEKTGLSTLLKGAEKEEGGVANQILEGKPDVGSLKVARVAARASSPQAIASLESFGAQLDAASQSARVEFSGGTRLTASEGLGGSARLSPLRASSSPVLETPINRLPVTRTQFGVTEPVVPKIPVGLKPGAPIEAGVGAGVKTTNTIAGRVPTFKEFSVAPPNGVGQQVRLAPEPGRLTTEIKAPPSARVPGVVTEVVDVRPPTGVVRTAETHLPPVESRVPAQTQIEPAHVQPKVDFHPGAAAAETHVPGQVGDLTVKPQVFEVPPPRVETRISEPVRADGVGAPETGPVRRVEAAPQAGTVARTNEVAGRPSKVVGAPNEVAGRPNEVAARTSEDPVRTAAVPGRTAEVPVRAAEAAVRPGDIAARSTEMPPPAPGRIEAAAAEARTSTELPAVGRADQAKALRTGSVPDAVGAAQTGEIAAPGIVRTQTVEQARVASKLGEQMPAAEGGASTGRVTAPESQLGTTTARVTTAETNLAGRTAQGPVSESSLKGRTAPGAASDLNAAKRTMVEPAPAAPEAGLDAKIPTTGKIGTSAERVVTRLTEPNVAESQLARANAVQSGEPVLRTGESGAIIGEPAVRTVEPVVRTVEPAAKIGEPVVRTGEPAAKIGEPVVRTGEPAARIAEPVVRTGEPAARIAEPVVRTVEPAAKIGDPVVRTGEPAARIAEPAATGEPAALQARVAGQPAEVVSERLLVQGKTLESPSALRSTEAEPLTVQPKNVTATQGAPLPNPITTSTVTGVERTASEIPNSLELREPVADAPLRVTPAAGAARADLTTGAGIATETRAAVQQSATELNRLQTIPGLSTEAVQTARTLETNLARMSGESAESMSLSARKRAMSDIENGLKSLKTELKGVEGAEQSLSGIDSGVTRLRAANDVALSEASSTASKAIAGDLQKTIQAIPNVEQGVAQSINHSLELIAAPEATAVEKRAALDELSGNVEKLRATTEPQTFAAMEKQVAELRAANTVGETVSAQTELEASATRLGDSAKTVRNALGSDAASTAAANALERIEQNSTTLAASRASSVAERQAAMNQIDADMRVLRESPAAAEVPQLERELATMRASENSVNLLKSEATFAEATPRFSTAIDEAIAKPGITAAERTELEALRTTAAKLEPSTYQALSDVERASVLTEADSRVTTLERQTGDVAALRESLNEVKSSASDLENARAASVEESGATSQVAARTTSTVDPALSKPRVLAAEVTEPAALEPQPQAVTERPPVIERTATEVGKPPVIERTATEVGKPPVAAADIAASERAGAARTAEKLPGDRLAAADRLAAERVASEADVAGTAVKPSIVSERVAADVDNAAVATTADAAVARTGAVAENDAIAARAFRTGEQGIAAPLASESEAASVRTAALEAPESRLAAQTSVVARDSAATVEQSTQALKDSLNIAVEFNGRGGLSGDAAVADRSLAAMQAELAPGRAPNIDVLKEQAAALPAEAAAPLLTRINGLSNALKSQQQLETLDKSVKTLDSSARALTAQLSQIHVPGMASTINDLRSGVVSLSDARDRASALKAMAEQFATLSPSLDSDLARRLGSTIDELQRTNARINSSLVDVISTQVARARDVSDMAQAKDALRILSSIVPDGSATSQLIRSASDQLMQAERAQQAADAALEARRSVFAFPSFKQQLAPVSGLQTSMGRLFSLQSDADAIAAARYPRSFAAASSPLLLTGGSLAAGGLGAYAYFNQSPSGTISGSMDLAHGPSDGSVINITTASASIDQSGVSNQSAFSLNTDAALSPLTMALIQDKNIQYNTTLAPNWESQNKALGFFATPFSPGAAKEEVAQTVFAPVRRLNLSTSTTGADVKPRLVYPGFAQRQLNEMATARRRGGLLSVFADNSTGVRGFGTGLQGGPQSGAATRIPTGLSKLLTREIISNGLDANNETPASAQGPSPNDPNAPAVLSLANQDNTPPAGSQSALTSASQGANRAKSVAV